MNILVLFVIVKPQPISVFKQPAPPSFDADDLKPPPRPPYGTRNNSQGSLNRDHLKLSLVSIVCTPECHNRRSPSL